jgi:hypothetical protein
MIRVKIIHLAISMLVIFAMFIPPNSARAQSGPAEDHTGGPRYRIELTLRANGAPLPGGTTQLSIDATPLVNAPEMEIHWVIPQGVQLLGSEVDTFSNISVNQSVHSERALNFPSAGTYKIAVSVRLHLAPEVTYGSSGVLFFVIDANGSRVTDKDPDAHRPVRSGPPVIVTTSVTPATINSQEPNDDEPCFTIFAHFDRIELPVTQFGYGAAIRVPLAGIAVEFRESDFLFDDSYGYLGTDANGDVTGSFCDDDGWFDDTLEIYLRLAAEKGDPIVYVEDSSWIDEEYEYDTDEVESDGGTINFTVNLDEEWSGIFNIVDAAFLARQLWVDNGGEYDEETEIHWEVGYGDEDSYYDEYYNEITIADDPSTTDQWNESVIMHEWGHSADDYYSCDDNPGGEHHLHDLLDHELAWGEGYPDYYQSAVRNAYSFQDPSFYLDIDGSGTGGIAVNLENWDFTHPSLVSTESEMAIAAALWDLNDTQLDGQDQVSHGHGLIQAVYTSSEFNDVAYGLIDDTCDFDTYMRGWVDYGAPADAKTAAAVKQNTGYTLVPNSQVAGNSTNAVTTNGFSPADVYRWWKLLTYVGDNSLSMNGPKFDAMKKLFKEAVNDLGDDPEGTEFTLELFNNTSPSNEVKFAGQFFPETLIDPINALTTISDPDTCPVYALRALAQAVDDKEKGDVWLFTDGDTVQDPSVDSIRGLLNENEIRASMALMGLCSGTAEEQVTQEPVSAEMLQGLTPEEQQSLMAERLLPGQARATLGPMADEVPGGIVPYLLTALNSGGQFLYVSADQAEDAADILRAQITNSAGAGRWSDYVSDTATYRYDRLASWEYDWIDAKAGTRWDNPIYNSKIDIPLPTGTYFQYYSGPYYNTVHVFEDGYLNFGLSTAYVSLNTQLPNPSYPNNALYPFWDDLMAFCPPGVSSPQACLGWIYTFQQGDWFAIEYDQYESFDPDSALNTFEILLNLDTYEIRYQYLSVPNGAASSTIGLENSNASDGVQISYNDVAYASNGMGYKFTPAPPQPTKTYTVTVDSSMDAIGFLLTGYSGSFEPLAVTDPDGTPINCSEPGALCLDLDLVQYVQVNTNGRTGDWQAVVDAGASGSGTFSFTSFAVSPIAVEGSINHTLSTTVQQVLVHVTGQVDGCVLSGEFRRMNGSPFGSGINFYDDGLHNDNHSCDGLFGSDSFLPVGAGSAYLTLHGLHGGEPFTRIDTVPYSFQPLDVVSLGDGVNYGGFTPLQFQFTNHDDVDHYYWLTYEAPEGWWMDLGAWHFRRVNAGQTAVFTFNVYMTPGVTNDLPSGTSGLLTLSATELEKGLISDSDSATITRHRPPYRINIFNPTSYLGPNGETSTLEFSVFDEQDVGVADGTEVLLITTMGVISPTVATTEGGVFHATFTSGAELGTAVITAIVRDFKDVNATTEIEIINPLPDRITLETSSNRLPADGVSTAVLTATVRDNLGNPMPNQSVRIGVEGDGQLGTISGEEVVSGETDANGQFSAIFTSGEVVAVVGVRAELLFDEGVGLAVVDYDRKEIKVGTTLYLPLLLR